MPAAVEHDAADATAPSHTEPAPASDEPSQQVPEHAAPATAPPVEATRRPLRTSPRRATRAMRDANAPGQQSSPGRAAAANATAAAKRRGPRPGRRGQPRPGNRRRPGDAHPASRTTRAKGRAPGGGQATAPGQQDNPGDRATPEARPRRLRRPHPASRTTPARATPAAAGDRAGAADQPGPGQPGDGATPAPARRTTPAGNANGGQATPPVRRPGTDNPDEQPRQRPGNRAGRAAEKQARGRLKPNRNCDSYPARRRHVAPIAAAHEQPRGPLAGYDCAAEASLQGRCQCRNSRRARAAAAHRRGARVGRGACCSVDAAARRGQVPLRRRREALRPRRHLRHVPRPTSDGRRVSPTRRVVERDFARDGRERASTPCAPTPCRRAGCSTRAAEHGLRVMVGLPWEQHVAFLDDRGARALDRARACARACARCAGHPGRALLRDRQRDPGADRALARRGAGSSASSSASTDAVEGRGPRRARHLRQLSRRPSTSSCRSSTSSASTSTSSRRTRLEAYLARLQNLAGDRPLLHGRDRARQPAQRRASGRRRSLDWQVRTRVRGRLRRRVRLRLDRRVAPRRARRSTTGTSGSPTRDREPKPALARGARGVRRRCRSPRDRLAARLGRRLQLQRRAHARATACDGAARRSTTRTTR